MPHRYHLSLDEDELALARLALSRMADAAALVLHYTGQTTDGEVFVHRVRMRLEKDAANALMDRLKRDKQKVAYNPPHLVYRNGKWRLYRNRWKSQFEQAGHVAGTTIQSVKFQLRKSHNRCFIGHRPPTITE